MKANGSFLSQFHLEECNNLNHHFDLGSISRSDRMHSLASFFLFHFLKGKNLLSTRKNDSSQFGLYLLLLAQWYGLAVSFLTVMGSIPARQTSHSILSQYVGSPSVLHTFKIIYWNQVWIIYTIINEFNSGFIFFCFLRCSWYLRPLREWCKVK